MKDNKQYCYPRRIALEKLKQKTWICGYQGLSRRELLGLVFIHFVRF